MIIDFEKLPLQILQNFKGGNLHYDANMFDDGKVKVMRGTLVPGASIGMHTHTDNCEVIIVTEGVATAVTPEGEESVLAGMAHYCPKGGTHSLINRTDKPIHFFAVVA